MDKLNLILLNGPAGSGKDYMARFINTEIINSYLVHPAEPSRKHVESMLGVTLTENVYNQTKNIPNPLLKGHSIREEMIHYSEEYMKPRFGKTIFSEMMWAKIQSLHSRQDGLYRTSYPFICTSLGFKEEVEFFYNLWKDEKIDGLLLCHVARIGTNFGGDSRYYVEPKDFPDLNYLQVDNNGDVADSVTDIISWLQTQTQDEI